MAEPLVLTSCGTAIRLVLNNNNNNNNNKINATYKAPIMNIAGYLEIKHK
jgi:hypothetical protein